MFALPDGPGQAIVARGKSGRQPAVVTQIVGIVQHFVQKGLAQENTELGLGEKRLCRGKIHPVVDLSHFTVHRQRMEDACIKALHLVRVDPVALHHGGDFLLADSRHSLQLRPRHVIKVDIGHDVTHGGIADHLDAPCGQQLCQVFRHAEKVLRGPADRDAVEV